MSCKTKKNQSFFTKIKSLLIKKSNNQTKSNNKMKSNNQTKTTKRKTKKSIKKIATHSIGTLYKKKRASK